MDDLNNENQIWRKYVQLEENKADLHILIPVQDPLYL